MKATIAVYNTHDDAVIAAKELKDAGYSTERVSIIGKSEKLTREERIANDKQITKTEGTDVGVGAAVGSALGILTGVGVFAIPGFGFLFGAGALVGAIAGFDIGLLGGGIFAALSISAVKDHHAKNYDTHLHQGRFLLIIQGSEEEVTRAKNILESHAKHEELDVHA